MIIDNGSRVRHLLLGFATSTFTPSTFATAPTIHGNAKSEPAARGNASRNLTNHSLGRLSLQPNHARPSKSRHEQTFSSSKDIGKALDDLNICETTNMNEWEI